MKVLLVDDHDANRAILARRLVRRGFQVVEAHDGDSVQSICAAERPDCILMDLSMPRVDGFEALRRVRSDPKLAEIPAIALTAHALEDIRARCAAVGFQAFHTKPIEFESLIGSIASLTRLPA